MIASGLQAGEVCDHSLALHFNFMRREFVWSLRRFIVI